MHAIAASRSLRLQPTGSPVMLPHTASFGIDTALLHDLLDEGYADFVEIDLDDPVKYRGADLVIIPSVESEDDIARGLTQAREGLARFGRLGMTAAMECPPARMVRLIPELLRQNGFVVTDIRRIAHRVAFVAANAQDIA